MLKEELITEEESIIQEGFFLNYCDKKEYPFCFKLLHQASIESILALQDRTYANLPDKEIYVPGTRETLMKDLIGEGLTGGIFAGEKLIAFSSVHFMQYDDSYLDIIPIQDIPVADLRKTARYRYTSVDPTFVRNGLSNKIATWLHNYILENYPSIQYFVSMVSPRNYPSLRQQIDLKIYGRSLKKNTMGLNRIILFKDIGETLKTDSKNNIIIAAVEDENIKKAFDKGYLLIDTILDNKKMYLKFST
jgi:hypothetical protein